MKIAVIDSGKPLETTLRVIKEYRIYVSKDYKSHVVTDNTHDENGHAAIVFAILAQYLKPDDEIISIKILDKNLRGNSIALIKSIYLALEEKCDLINISLGTTNTKYIAELHKAVKTTAAEGVVMVSANGNRNGEVSYPSNFVEAIGIMPQEGDFKLDRIKYDPIQNNIYTGTNQPLRINDKEFDICGTSYVAPHITGLLKQTIEMDFSKVPYRIG